MGAIVFFLEKSVFSQPSDRHTYRNQRHGFEIRYPHDWKFQEYAIRGGEQVVYAALNPVKTINSTPARKCAEKGQMCGGIAGILCCAGLDCKLSGTFPDASGTCEVQTASSICEPGEEYRNTAVEPVKCKCPEGYEFKVLAMSWGPCPREGMHDCPASVLKCVSIK